MLQHNMSLQELLFHSPATLSPQLLFDVRSAVRISAALTCCDVTFGTVLLGTTTGVMFGLRDRQQFRKALGLPQLSDDGNRSNDQQTDFGVSAQLLKLNQKLGEGQFGYVYSCNMDGQTMCVKEPKTTKENSLDVVQVRLVFEHLDLILMCCAL
jgi:hypothetical protein